MSDPVVPACSSEQSRRVSIKRNSLGLGQQRDGVVFNYQTIESNEISMSKSTKAEYFLSHKLTALVLSALIIVYSVLVVIRIAFESEIDSVSKELDILELVFLVIFVAEVSLRIFAYKWVRHT